MNFEGTLVCECVCFFNFLGRKRYDGNFFHIDPKLQRQVQGLADRIDRWPLEIPITHHLKMFTRLPRIYHIDNFLA